jgi:hypothetical protein
MLERANLCVAHDLPDFTADHLSLDFETMLSLDDQLSSSPSSSSSSSLSSSVNDLPFPVDKMNKSNPSALECAIALLDATLFLFHKAYNIDPSSSVVMCSIKKR